MDISLDDVLAKMQVSNVKGNKTPFHITWISWDEKRDDGGVKKTIKRAVLMDSEDREYHSGSGTGKGKKPNHYEHSTRNIVDLDDPTKHPVKVHIRLIVQFDHKYVHW